jgi:hypothetical protein
LLVYCKSDPSILETTGIVPGEAQVTPGIIATESGKHAQFHQQLEPVTDSQDKPAVIHELDQTINQRLTRDQRMANSVGACLSCAEIVPVKKSPREDNDLVRREVDFSASDEIEVHKVNGVESGKLQRSTGFQLAVDTVTSGHKRLEIHIDSSLKFLIA